MNPARWLLVVDATVDPAVEDDWNRWYDEIHLPEILACPGFVAGARYASESHGRRSYLTVYEIADAGATRTEEFSSRRGWGPYEGSVDATVRVFQRGPR